MRGVGCKGKRSPHLKQKQVKLKQVSLKLSAVGYFRRNGLRLESDMATISLANIINKPASN